MKIRMGGFDKPMRVVVFEEADSSGRAIWVAQALEADMAAQAALGANWSAAIAELGTLFDARDAILTKELNVAPAPPAPVEYEQMWEAGTSIGSWSLGNVRRADVRRFDRHKSDDKGADTFAAVTDEAATMTIPHAPSEHAKAVARLAQAAMLFSMSALKQGASTLAAMADVNDLSFRRNEGKIDLAPIYEDIDGERAQQLLLDAARSFAVVDAAEKDAADDALIHRLNLILRVLHNFAQNPINDGTFAFGLAAICNATRLDIRTATEDCADLVDRGLAEEPTPGNFRITPNGVRVLAQSEDKP